MFPFPDIVGDNATHQITSSQITTQPAEMIQIIVTGTGTVRLADHTASATVGLPLAAGGGFMLPWRGRGNGYTAGAFYVYVPSGATVSVAAIF